MLEVPVATLRTWEDRYAQVVPAIVAVSAVEAMDAAIEAGADAFLRKPIDPLQLVSTVRDLLRSSACSPGRAADGRRPADQRAPAPG
jgi:DNA-binding response OmpR family regulator